MKAAFLKTGPAQKDLYFRSPRESKKKIHYLFLLEATYGLVNATTNFQKQSDDIIINLGLQHLGVVPQLFYLIKDSWLVLLVVKIVDVLPINGITSEVKSFLFDFNKEFSFCTVVSGPGVLKFYCLSILQLEDFSS